jgi:L-alanine-DL-glutamate epimerase-like enolase superfamily enzyme
MADVVPTVPGTADPVRGSAPLTIEHVETVPIRVPLARVYRGSQYHMTHRSTTVCRVHLSGGIVGEAYAGDEDATLLEIDKVIHDELAPALRGEDARAIERCWQLTRPATFDILRDRRVGLVAAACIDAALWDAIGKSLGEPLWRLWGGFRNALPMISIGGYYGEDADIAAEVAELREMGLAGMNSRSEAAHQRRTPRASRRRAKPRGLSGSCSPTRTRAGPRRRRNASPAQSSTST